MTAKAQRHAAITHVGEEVEEVFVPAPGGVPGSMDEEQRYWVGIGAPAFVNHFEHWSFPVKIAAKEWYVTGMGSVRRFTRIVTPAAEARMSGVFMPQPIWGLSGTDDRCDLYNPGHQIHWIHFNHSMREPSVLVPVTAAVDDDGLVHIDADEVSLVRWHHRAALVRDALHRFGGMAVWKPRWHILAVPTDFFVGGARTVFSLATLDQRRACYAFRSTNPDHLVPGTRSPTNVPPLRIAARYAAGRRCPPNVGSSGRERRT